MMNNLYLLYCCCIPGQAELFKRQETAFEEWRSSAGGFLQSAVGQALLQSKKMSCQNNEDLEWSRGCFAEMSS